MHHITRSDMDVVINNGRDVDLPRISGCNSPNLDWCEANCAKYYGCGTVAYANDILVAYEDGVFL